MVNILKNVSACSDDVIERLSKEDSATIHEAMGQRGAMDSEIKPLARGMKLCGRAVTVKCHAADNLMLIKAISMARPNDVIVADFGDIQYSGPFGEVLATECIQKKLGGLIVNVSVRDSARLIKMNFPVFSRGVSITGTAKGTLGTINHPICCGGVIVNPGDVILGDDDGVVVIPATECENVLSAAIARREKEEKIIQRLKMK